MSALDKRITEGKADPISDEERQIVAQMAQRYIDRKDSNPARMLGGSGVYCVVFIGLALLAWLR